MDSRARSRSDSETCIAKARARFDLLKSIHSLVVRSLPTIEDIDNGQHEFASEDDLANIANDIIILRSDIKCLPIKLQQIDMDQGLAAVNVNKLNDAFDILLDSFESLVRDLDDIKAHAVTPGVRTKSIQFSIHPKKD